MVSLLLRPVSSSGESFILIWDHNVILYTIWRPRVANSFQCDGEFNVNCRLFPALLCLNPSIFAPIAPEIPNLGRAPVLSHFCFFCCASPATFALLLKKNFNRYPKKRNFACIFYKGPIKVYFFREIF